MSERKRIYLCLAHMSDEGLEQKYIKKIWGIISVFRLMHAI